MDASKLFLRPEDVVAVVFVVAPPEAGGKGDIDRGVSTPALF